jgi:hypothetical protein
MDTGGEMHYDNGAGDMSGQFTSEKRWKICYVNPE